MRFQYTPSLQHAAICFRLPRLTVFFKGSSLALIKYKMIIYLRSICILNANCEVLIDVPSLCTAKDFISLSIFLAMDSLLNSPLPLHHPLPNLFPPIICLLSLLSVLLRIFSFALFTFSCPALPFLPSLLWSYRRITLIDIAVCFRSRVDEEGALCCCVDLFPALILIGVAYS